MPLGTTGGTTGREECKRWEYCSARMCPLLTNEELEKFGWYPDDDICTSKEVPGWIKRQRRLAQKVRNVDSYFTLKMLKHTCKITSALAGISYGTPQSKVKQAIKEWFAQHPTARELTEAEKSVKERQLVSGREKLIQGTIF